MKIGEFLKKYNHKQRISINHEITKITESSNKVINGAVFVANQGYTTDGHKYINDAISRGASTIIVNSDYQERIDKQKRKVNILRFDNPKKEYARLLKMFYEPKFTETAPIIIGVTGTSGKTTTTTVLYQYFKSKQYDVLLIGTSGNYSYYGGMETKLSTENTTPRLEKIYELLFQNSFNYDYMIMEVSSQGISEGRILGIDFDIVVFTNLAKEHLDYHKTLNDYKHTKGRIFIKPPRIGAVLNHDSPFYSYYDNLSIDKTISFGIEKGDIKAEISHKDLNGTIFNIIDGSNRYLVKTPLVGEFNIYNLLATYAVLKFLDENVSEVINFYESDIFIRGRMEILKVNNRTIIVDYAHTINAVENVLKFLSEIKIKNLITVIGSGGNRDSTKRSVFGNFATKYSDHVYFTEDNSRFENVRNIVSDMLEGVVNHNYDIIYNRYLAIEAAILNSEENDIIAILGRGDEEEMKGRNTIHFNDMEVVKEIIGGK